MIEPRPKVIFFDAVGTLFGVKGSVGQIYRAIAADFGVEVAPWELYDDTLTTLAALRSAQIPLGVLSNFDSRLHRVLPALGLADYFQSVS